MKEKVCREVWPAKRSSNLIVTDLITKFRPSRAFNLTEKFIKMHNLNVQLMRRKQVTGLGRRTFNFSFNKLNVICYAN